MHLLTIPTPPKPSYLYRVTDTTSHTLPSPSSGNFDTGTHTGASWSEIICIETLNRQLSTHHKNDEDGDEDEDEEEEQPIFLISTTASPNWASSEHRRRLFRKRRRDVRTYRIDLSRFEWEYVELVGEKGDVRFPVLRSPGWECVVFSTDCATQGLNWWNHRRDSLEWFAVVCIPSKFVDLVEVDGVLLSAGSTGSDASSTVSWAG